MCFLYVSSKKHFLQIVPESARISQLAFWGMGMLVIAAILPATMAPAFASVSPIQLQRPGKSASAHVGAAMAVLATLEQAHVLPPEGTTEANRIIKSAIQLQSLFTQNTDLSVREFMRQAVVNKHGEQTAQIVSQFRSGGWTPDVLEALADKTFSSPAEELAQLGPGLASVNLSVDDLQHFMLLIRDGERELASDGRNFHEVFASFRKTMPGAAGR